MLIIYPVVAQSYVSEYGTYKADGDGDKYWIIYIQNTDENPLNFNHISSSDVRQRLTQLTILMFQYIISDTTHMI